MYLFSTHIEGTFEQFMASWIHLFTASILWIQLIIPCIAQFLKVAKQFERILSLTGADLIVHKSYIMCLSATYVFFLYHSDNRSTRKWKSSVLLLLSLGNLFQFWGAYLVGVTLLHIPLPLLDRALLLGWTLYTHQTQCQLVSTQLLEYLLERCPHWRSHQMSLTCVRVGSWQELIQLWWLHLPLVLCLPSKY